MPLEMFSEMASLFGDVVTVDPLTAALFVVGNVLLGFTIVVFGLLTLGSLGSLFTPP